MSGGQHGKMEQVVLECAVCSNVTFIWRRASRLKEPNHVKHMWCASCHEVRPHKELRAD